MTQNSTQSPQRSTSSHRTKQARNLAPSPYAFHIVTFVIACISLWTQGELRAWTVDSLRAEAEKGNANAAARLSAAYHLGLGVGKDPASAYRWAQRAASSNQGFALFSLAECLRCGDGTIPRPSEAHTLYKRAVPLLQEECALYQAESFYALSVCFAHGLALPVREDSAAWYLNRSAAMNYAPALHQYYRTPLIAAQNERDSLVALAFLRGAADQLYEPAMIELAGLLSQRAATQDLAFLYARRAAALGSAQGAYQCGAFRYAAVGVGHDTVQSQKWFEQAARGAYLKAHAELGYRHAHGIGVPLDKDKARLYFLGALALNTDDRPGLSAFIHDRLDSLPCSSQQFDNVLLELQEQLRTILGASGHPASYSAPALSSAARKVWKRVYVCTDSSARVDSEDEYLAFARNASMRHVVLLHDSVISREDGSWSLSEDAQLLTLKHENLQQSWKVLVLSPGLLAVRSETGVKLFERVASAAVQRIPAFRGSQQFGEVVLSARKAELTDKGSVRLRLMLRNVPADGVVIAVDSIHLASMSYGQNDRKQSFRIQAPEMIFEDGEVVLTIDVHTELKASIQEGHCQLELSAVYAIDDAYRQCSMRSGDIALPQQLK